MILNGTHMFPTLLSKQMFHYPFFKLLNKFYCPKIHSLRVYLSFMRLLLEYACPVCRSQLSNELSDKMESVQKRSLRIIYKEGKIPYSFLLKAARITTLKERIACFSLNQSFPIPVPRTYSLIVSIPLDSDSPGQPPQQSQLTLRSMLLQRGFVKVLYPLFWNTLIIIRDMYLQNSPFPLLPFLFSWFTAMFL